jgi:hypothetical protein
MVKKILLTLFLLPLLFVIILFVDVVFMSKTTSFSVRNGLDYPVEVFAVMLSSDTSKYYNIPIFGNESKIESNETKEGIYIEDRPSMPFANDFICFNLKALHEGNEVLLPCPAQGEFISLKEQF